MIVSRYKSPKQFTDDTAVLTQVQLAKLLNPAHTGDFDIRNRPIQLADKYSDSSIVAGGSCC